VADAVPTITVLAGTNGAGKSSIGGALLAAAATPFYNPDVETQALLAANPGMSLSEANAEAWRIGKERLQSAIANRHSFNFETTLGGSTITHLLAQAHNSGLRARMWYCGLSSAELHIQRVQARVRHGGHDVPEAKICERYDASRSNLCTLLPSLDELMLYDNNADADPHTGQQPQPVKLLHYRDGQILYRTPSMPEWAKPIAAVALSHSEQIRSQVRAHSPAGISG
jgi:predicted ABC-type ATPase